MTLPTIDAGALPRLAYSHGDAHDPALTEPAKFRPVLNAEGSVKPRAGGLWTSPVGKTGPAGEIIETAWTAYCRSESVGPDRCTHFLEIAPAPRARSLRVDGQDDLRAVHDQYALPAAGISFPGLPEWAVLDWERMAEDGWDAVYLTERGQYETRFPEDPGMSWYGWDVATVLWLRPSYKVVTP